MKNRKTAFLFFFLLSFPFLCQASNVSYPILFQMQAIDKSGDGWNEEIWVHTNGIGQSDASCPQGSEACHLYIQMQKNSSIEIQIVDTFAFMFIAG